MSEILKVENLCVKYQKKSSIFSKKDNFFYAVDDISFSIKKGQCVGLVGESGSGKTTTGRAIIKLAPVSGGKIFFEGKQIDNLSERNFKPFRKDIQMIFQDPFNSLDPRMKILATICEPINIHFAHLSKQEKIKRANNLMEMVGLDKDFLNRYPHEFSGGQRQRIGIARALACQPKLIICDEPVSALDVSVQAQIINLLQDIGKKLNISYLFVAHDLAVVRHISDYVLVMNKGKIVEQNSSNELYQNPQNEYTKKLLASVCSI